MTDMDKRLECAISGLVVFGVSCFTFAFLANPIVYNPANAQTATDTTTLYTASISNSGSIDLNIQPSNSQQVFTATDEITYSNTCPYGFDVMLSSAGDDNNLTRQGDDSLLKTIAATDESNAVLADNSWGFSTTFSGGDNELFSPVPVPSNSTTILNTETATTEPATFNVTYGVKTDNSMPSGEYVADVVYTVAVKPECIRYTLNWDLNGGTGADGISYDASMEDYNTTINLANYTPTRAGYKFEGWSNGTQTFTGEEIAANVNSGNMSNLTLTAQWSIIPYSISYELNSGAVGTANPTDYNVETDEITLNNPTRNGYDFAGWTGTDLSSASTSVKIPKGSTGDRSYTANWTPTNYTITYNYNGGSASNKTTYNIETATFTLTNPSRGGYNFTGWGGTGISGTTGTVTIPKGSTGNRSYTAYWSEITMQNYSCNLSTGQSTTMKDARDGNTYRIAKLADGRCWMTQNLRLIGIGINNGNSDTAGNFTVPGSNSNWADSLTAAYTYNTGNGDYGVYYNYYTATAGTISGSSNGSAASYSICPKGWKLPTSGEWQTLFNAYGITNTSNGSAIARSAPLYMVYSGYHQSGTTITGYGWIGGDWTASAPDGTYRYRVHFGDTYIVATNYTGRGAGFPIRCVKR